MSSHLELPRTDAVRHPRRYLLESLRPAARWILRRRYDVVVHGAERVPASGPGVFAAVSRRLETVSETHLAAAES